MDPKLIFDVGMHIGQDTEFYLKKGFRVIAIEANPVLIKAAREKYAAAIEAGRLIIEGVGIGPKEGVLPFYVNRSVSEWSSFNKHLGSRSAGADVVDVPVVRLNNLIEKHGVPYYLKIDIEGYDLHAIKSLGAIKERPIYVSFEAVPDNLDGVAMLFGLGYGEFKLVNQRLFPDYVLPDPSLEGLHAQHTFMPGSSGPFGEETPLKWSTFTEVVMDYVKCMKFDREDRRQPRPWWDFHCKNTRQLRKHP